MNFAADQLLVAVAVGGALAYFAMKVLRRGKKGCDTGCGCGVTKRGVVKRP
jgi:hypothetical protein